MWYDNGGNKRRQQPDVLDKVNVQFIVAMIIIYIYIYIYLYIYIYICYISGCVISMCYVDQEIISTLYTICMTLKMVCTNNTAFQGFLLNTFIQNTKLEHLNNFYKKKIREVTLKFQQGVDVNNPCLVKKKPSEIPLARMKKTAYYFSVDFLRLHS